MIHIRVYESNPVYPQARAYPYRTEIIFHAAALCGNLSGAQRTAPILTQDCRGDSLNCRSALGSLQRKRHIYNIELTLVVNIDDELAFNNQDIYAPKEAQRKKLYNTLVSNDDQACGDTSC